MNARKVAGDELVRRRETARQGGGPERVQAQHEKGKLTARERIALLLDPDTFQEIDPYIVHRHGEFGLERQRVPGDSVVTGFGRIDGRHVGVYAQDFTVMGGSFSEAQALKVGRLMEMATEAGAPVIALNDSVGARIQEGVWSLAGYADLFWRNTQASGVVPQISVMLGPCAGGSVYSPGLTDFVIMARGVSHMFITGPDVIRTVTGEEVDLDTLGGAETHATRSGVAHFVASDEREALALARRLLTYLPSNNAEDPPLFDPQPPLPGPLEGLVPEAGEQAYDVRQVIERIFDGDAESAFPQAGSPLPGPAVSSFLEVHADFAPNAVVGFARLMGRTAAVIANQPMHLAGVLDIDAADKIARFVRFADAFNLPLITFVDCPGFLPGVDQEHRGIIRHGAKIVYAYAEASVPKISVVLRKAYGGAYIVMSSKYIRTDLCFAWPTAEIAVMGAEGAVNILYGRQLAQAGDDGAERARLIGAFRERFSTPFAAAESGHIDDVIRPSETRARLAAALDFLRDKQSAALPKKHGNMPV